MEPAAAGVLYAAENLLSGAAAIVKGITHPTLPLKANLTHITSTPVPRSGHSLSVVKGRAYIFGGESAPGVLADNDMQIVILPSSGVLEADYTTINVRSEKADGAVPAPRKGHSSVVIGDSIYIFGGEGVESENGRVWAFHTVRNTWSFLDPASETLFPSHRAGHSSATSEYPGPKDVTFQEKAPQQPADPAKVVPKPADPDTWGTIFVVGGHNPQSGEVLNDALAFDVKSRTWSNIPSPSGAAKVGVSMTLVENRLYTFGGRAGEKEGEMTATAATQYLDVSPVWKHAEGGTTPLTSGWAWEDLSPSGVATASADKHSSAPQPRSGAGLTGVTTGQGRHYVVLIGGSSPAPDSNTTILDDIWAFQLPSEKTSAAAAKDSARAGAKRETYEGHWAEVKYQYVDAKGEIEQERESAMTGVGARNGFAVAKGTEVDGASVVVWGGVGVDGNVLGDGWLVTVER